MAKRQCQFHTTLGKLLMGALVLIAYCVMPCKVTGEEINKITEATLEHELSQTGTISFELVTDKRYANGRGQGNLSQSLLKIPGLMEIAFRRSDPVVNVLWTWEQRDPEGKTFYDIVADFSELPGPERFFFQFTWDSAQGVSLAYFNGQPLRVESARFEPWWISQPATRPVLGDGALRIENLKVLPDYTPVEQLRAAVPAEFMGRHHRLIGYPHEPGPINIPEIRGVLLYESSMDTPDSLTRWVAEGPLDLRFTGGGVQMRSENFAQHTVFWCPEDFPPSFVAEWDFKPLSRYGLAIVFFAAKGENGEDIFDPALPERDGAFIHYIKGAIKSYHISYFANIENYQMGRVDSNMRKNNDFYKVGGGPIAVPPGNHSWHQMRLLKDGNHIQLYADGQIFVDWKDEDPNRYGPALGSGKIGLRQMMPTVALYKNFRVWSLK